MGKNSEPAKKFIKPRLNGERSCPLSPALRQDGKIKFGGRLYLFLTKDTVVHCGIKGDPVLQFSTTLDGFIVSSTRTAAPIRLGSTTNPTVSSFGWSMHALAWPTRTLRGYICVVGIWATDKDVGHRLRTTHLGFISRDASDSS